VASKMYMLNAGPTYRTCRPSTCRPQVVRGMSAHLIKR
jgi:hypothetical protein